MGVIAWLMDSTDADQREKHQLDPNEPVSGEALEKLGVRYYKFEPVCGNYTDNEEYKALKVKEGYTYQDQVTCSREKLPDYENKLKDFFREHLHDDDEVRYIVEGSGYFDVRNKDDQWIRIALTPGELITLPSGIYHRFTLDTNNYVKAVRLFKGDPVWTPINHPADEHPSRLAYLQERAAAC